MIDNFQKAEMLFYAMIGALEDREVDNPKFWTDGEKILCKDEVAINCIADFLDDIAGYGVCCTGYYDPEEDERSATIDEYTGYHYLELAE